MDVRTTTDRLGLGDRHGSYIHYSTTPGNEKKQKSSSRKDGQCVDGIALCSSGSKMSERDLTQIKEKKKQISSYGGGENKLESTSMVCICGPLPPDISCIWSLWCRVSQHAPVQLCLSSSCCGNSPDSRRRVPWACRAVVVSSEVVGSGIV